jgi:hypothetical protein
MEHHPLDDVDRLRRRSQSPLEFCRHPLLIVVRPCLEQLVRVVVVLGDLVRVDDHATAEPVMSEGPGQEVAVIEIPPRAFCLSVTFTSSADSSSASATSSRILTASASQKFGSSRKPTR